MTMTSSPYLLAVILVIVTGLYCVIVTRNLIRALLGLELLTKAVTLLIIGCGYVADRVETAQAMVIALITVEVVVVAVAAMLIVVWYRATSTLDTRLLREPPS